MVILSGRINKKYIKLFIVFNNKYSKTINLLVNLVT